MEYRLHCEYGEIHNSGGRVYRTHMIHKSLETILSESFVPHVLYEVRVHLRAARTTESLLPHRRFPPEALDVVGKGSAEGVHEADVVIRRQGPVPLLVCSVVGLPAGREDCRPRGDELSNDWQQRVGIAARHDHQEAFLLRRPHFNSAEHKYMRRRSSVEPTLHERRFVELDHHAATADHCGVRNEVLGADVAAEVAPGNACCRRQPQFLEEYLPSGHLEDPEINDL